MSKPKHTPESLKAGGYDGLYHPSVLCGCEVDDLRPCWSGGPTCKPGHRSLRSIAWVGDPVWLIGPNEPVSEVRER